MLRPFTFRNCSTICWTLSSRLVLTLAFLLLQPLAPLFAEQLLEVEFNLFKLPSSRQSLMALNSPAIATFEKRPLGECLKTLAAAYRVSIWVDRRVDLSRLVSIVGIAANEPLEAKTTIGRLVAVAKLGGADAGLIENVVYVGPADQVGVVQRAAVRLHNEIMTQRKPISNGDQVELRTLSWEDVTTPAELLDTIQRLWAVQVPSKLPHDLMHAGQLPSSTLATQLTLLHAGFDRQVEYGSSGKFTVSPLVHESVWKADYADKELHTDRLIAARREFPKATMQTRGKVSTVSGPTGFHLRLLANRVPNARLPEPKFTMKDVRGPLERVIDDLAKNLNLQVEWSEDIPQSKRQAVVNFGVSEWKTTDEILKQFADDNGLKIQRQQQTIEVLP